PARACSHDRDSASSTRARASASRSSSGSTRSTPTSVPSGRFMDDTLASRESEVSGELVRQQVRRGSATQTSLDADFGTTPANMTSATTAIGIEGHSGAAPALVPSVGPVRGSAGGPMRAAARFSEDVHPIDLGEYEALADRASFVEAVEA